jgi:hypothetical protein
MKNRKSPQKYPYGYGYQAALIKLAHDVRPKKGEFDTFKTLVSFVNKDTGTAYPSKKALAEKSLAGERTVIRHIQALEALGLIQAVGYRGGGHGRATDWKFALPAWTTVEVYTAKMAELIKNNPAILSNNPAILSSYPAILADQPDRTINKQRDDEERASRPHGLSTNGLRLCPATNQPKTFTEFCKGVTYGEARKLWDDAEICAEPVEEFAAE